MAIKEKLWIIALLAGVLSFIGFVTPYISMTILGITISIWSFGLATISIGVAPAFVTGIVFAGILILISAILLIAGGVLARKREDLKLTGVIWVVGAILGLIGVFVPLGNAVLSAMLLLGGTLSVGFYLPLVGSIIGIAAGAGAFLLK